VTLNVSHLKKSHTRHFQGFVHVSTAYSHCPRDEIKEQLYLTPITAEELKERLHHDADDSTIK